MNLDLYRTFPSHVVPSSGRRARPARDLAVVLALAWALAVLRVVAALARAEAVSVELNLAWLTVIVAPILIWSELAAARRDRG